jgi:hypothetical protein
MINNQSMSRLLICLSFLALASCVYHNNEAVMPSGPVIQCDSISWEKHILPIMASSCATPGCHDGIARLDWRDYDEVKKFAQSVRIKTQDRSMPVDATLSLQQIETIACWVSKGAPDN